MKVTVLCVVKHSVEKDGKFLHLINPLHSNHTHEQRLQFNILPFNRNL